MAVNEDNYNDDDDKQDEQRGRNKIPHWMMISISCHFIQSIQFICLLANLFEQTMHSRFFIIVDCVQYAYFIHFFFVIINIIVYILYSNAW